MRNSSLLLGSGQPLSISKISQLTTLKQTHLVVLSACETGVSSIRSNGTEISGISAYFLDREAKSVMASLWRVNDASTAILMQTFYRGLANGKSKAEALRQAQLNLLQTPQAVLFRQLERSLAKTTPQLGNWRSRIQINAPTKVTSQPVSRTPGYIHPYYWAAFTLMGNSR